MAFKITIKKEAEEDIYNAYTYYETIQTGLGDRFLEVLSVKLDIIQDSPDLYSYVSAKRKYRDIGLDKFPYLVVYEIDRQEVIVYMVHNTHKKQKY